MDHRTTKAKNTQTGNACSQRLYLATRGEKSVNVKIIRLQRFSRPKNIEHRVKHILSSFGISYLPYQHHAAKINLLLYKHFHPLSLCNGVKSLNQDYAKRELPVRLVQQKPTICHVYQELTQFTCSSLRHSSALVSEHDQPISVAQQRVFVNGYLVHWPGQRRSLYQSVPIIRVQK